MGGGQGAYRIWENMVKSLLKNKEHFDQAYIVTGPYLEKDDAIRLKKWAAELPWLHVLEYVPNMMAWMAASNLFIGAAGSNMLGEILATKCNAIVIPRQVREVEQKIHSALLKERGFVRVCDLEGVYDGKLDQQIYDGLQEPIAFRQSIQMNGTSAYSDILNLNKILV
nr:glycosyltransferase [Paenibacillus shirakamiensis]